MSLETALRARLKADVSVKAIVSTRIDWDVRPERSAYPAVVLQIVSDPRLQHMKGLMGSRPTRVQIDCFGRTPAEKVELREAVIAAAMPAATEAGVTFQRAFVNDVISRSKNTETGFVHHDLIDMTFWHNSQ